MERQARASLALQAALMATAGCVDAIGFLRLGRIFVSFMSGDSTKLVIAASQADWTYAAALGVVIALFVAGAFVGRLAVRLARSRARPAVLALEALLLAAAAAMGSARLAVAAMTLAMGLQNAAGLRRGERELPLTYVTGLLVDFAERLADAVWAPHARSRWGWAPSLALWLSLLAGAAIGAGAYGMLAMRALVFPAVAAAALALITLPARPRPTKP